MFVFEDIYLYRPGGFHPVHLGDTFSNGRYVVEHKLGHGGCSTLWLARDLQQSRLVAVKIFAASLSKDSRASAEAAFLRKLNPCRQKWTVRKESFPTPEYFPTLLDEFTIHGPNGIHGCIVTEVLGPSLLCFLDEYENYVLSTGASREIALWLASAVAELHNHGIVHGDIHPKNVLLSVPGLEAWTLDEIYEYFGEPMKVAINDIPHPSLEPFPATEHLPRYLVRDMRYSDKILSLCLEEVTVNLIDFGNSFFCSGNDRGVQKVIGTPAPFAAPEVQLGDILTPAIDVWSLGCVLYDLFSNTYLFAPMPGERDSLLDLTICFGKLPDRWWRMWGERGRYYSDDGQINPDQRKEIPLRRGDLETRLSRCRRRIEADDEYAWFRGVMVEMQKLNPKERMASADVLHYLPPSWWDVYAER